MIEYDEKAANPSDKKPLIVGYSKVCPTAIVHLHFKATRGEADRYGSQMFTFKISEDMTAISPYFKDADTIWLFYRRRAHGEVL